MSLMSLNGARLNLLTNAILLSALGQAGCSGQDDQQVEEDSENGADSDIDTDSDTDSDSDSDTDSDSETETDIDTETDTDSDTSSDSDSDAIIDTDPGDDDTDSEAEDWGIERMYPSNQTRPWSWDGSLTKLLTWTPAADKDADYNRSQVPLKTRFTNQDYWVNTNARNDGQVAVTTPWYLSEQPNSYVSGGADYFTIYTYPFWQYIDIFMIFNNWHNTLSAELFDVAHRNGVKVYNLIMNPTASDLAEFLQDDGAGNFPGADVLIDMAVYYGFDGWFFNLEKPGNSGLAQKLRDFFIYFNQQGTPKGISAMMYDAWNESGAVKYQNELNAANDWYFQYGDHPGAHEYFLNYWYNRQKLINSRDLAIQLGRSPYDVFAGFETWMHYWNTGGNLEYPVWEIFPQGDAHRLSLACFQMNGARDVARDNADYYLQEEQFYSGYNHNPANTNTSYEWPGIANYYPVKSVIDAPPFVTHFNTGQGHIYSIDAQVLRDRKWYNRTLQDILPHWRWVVESVGEKLKPEFDWKNAFYGGSSLKVTGSLVADNLIKLYLTRLMVSEQSQFTIAVKTGSADAPTHMRVALSFEDDSQVWQYLDVGHTVNAGWNLKRLDLSDYQGKVVGAIGLFFDGSADDEAYKMHIGRMGIIEGQVDIPDPPSDLIIEDKVEDTPGIASIRLKWTASLSDVRGYNIYRRNPDQSSTFLGSAVGTTYFVPSCKKVGNETSTPIEIEAISHEFGHSERISVEMHWE
ncbi:MAG: hypothetical protein QNJ97_00450 [Myxococcota bacterium]|nr:hypothetical protein [Myxococcota bacterium]